jgi:hypothetical protein
MVFRAWQFMSSLEIGGLILATKQQQSCLFVSTCFRKTVERGNKQATKQPQSGNSVSALFPLGPHSNFCLEVLRLGLVWVQSQNFHHCNGSYFA